MYGNHGNAFGVPLIKRIKSMMKVILNNERCKGCGLCVAVCPKKILQLQKDNRNSKGYLTAECIASGECIACKRCVTICPDCVITLKREIKD